MGIIPRSYSTNILEYASQIGIGGIIQTSEGSKVYLGVSEDRERILLGNPKSSAQKKNACYYDVNEIFHNPHHQTIRRHFLLGSHSAVISISTLESTLAEAKL